DTQARESSVLSSHPDIIAASGDRVDDVAVETCGGHALDASLLKPVQPALHGSEPYAAASVHMNRARTIGRQPLGSAISGESAVPQPSNSRGAAHPETAFAIFEEGGHGAAHASRVSIENYRPVGPDPHEPFCRAEPDVRITILQDAHHVQRA